MEAGMGESYIEARKRLTKTILSEVREIVDKTLNYTSFNALPKFTPAQVDILLSHIDECHKILFELAELNDYELPYRCPKLIYAARDLKRVVS